MKIETYFTKEDLKNSRVSKTRFYYAVSDSPAKRYNILVKVYSLRRPDGSPICLGYAEANTAAYVDHYGCAVQVIAEIFGYKNDGYRIARKGISIFQIC